MLVRAVTLLSMRGDARCILAKRSQWGACPLDPCETDLRLQKTIDGSGPLFRGCYLQRIVQLERVIRESGAAAKPSPRERAVRALISPRISHRAGAGVGGGVRGELAVELGEQRNAVGEAIFRAGGGERGILRRRRAVDDEARTRKRLEHRCQGRIADRVVRPGHPRA